MLMHVKMSKIAEHDDQGGFRTYLIDGAKGPGGVRCDNHVALLPDWLHNHALGVEGKVGGELEAPWCVVMDAIGANKKSDSDNDGEADDDAEQSLMGTLLLEGAT